MLKRYYFKAIKSSHQGFIEATRKARSIYTQSMFTYNNLDSGQCIFTHPNSSLLILEFLFHQNFRKSLFSVG